MQGKNYTIFRNTDTIQSRHATENAAKQKQNGNRKSIDARSMTAVTDSVAAKKSQAQKKAMKIIGDAFAGESKIDDDTSARREKVKSLTQELADRKQEIKDMEDTKASLLEQGYDENSDEVRQLSEGLKEYNKQAMDTQNELTTENAVIRQTKIERLKSNPMGEARDQADAVMGAASDEIMGMLIDEGRDHIDEKQEEEKKKAQEAQEKKQELEEKLEARKEDRKGQEQLTRDIVEAAQKLNGGTDSVAQAQQEIKDMMNKLKLVEDDVKGAAVDQGI